jgi:hypothetical protein
MGWACSATVAHLGLGCFIFKLGLRGSHLYKEGRCVIRRQARRIHLGTTQGLLREGEYQVYLAIAINTHSFRTNTQH